MFNRANAANSVRGCFVLSILVSAIALMVCTPANAQTVDNNNNNLYGRAVGGISVDAEGLLNNSQLDDMGALGKLRQETIQKAPEGMNAASNMRKISLRRLEAALQDCITNNKPIPDDVKYLAGLQRINYVFVYPEQKDVVLVGVGEGWKVDAKGNVVGIESGRPVMLLDDLLVALRTARGAAQGGITCSIDPTPEGIQRMQSLPGPQMNSQQPQAQEYASALAKALGLQQISIHGVPTTSHFARVLVAADYRMKEIAMSIAPSPIRALPSYLQMFPTRAAALRLRDSGWSRLTRPFFTTPTAWRSS